MQRSELFLLFPISDKVQTKPIYMRNVDFASEIVFEKVVAELTKIMIFLSSENHIRYYDAKNLDAFISCAKEEGEDYLFPETTILQMMKEWEDWREEKKQISTKKYTFYYTPIDDNTLCEMTERIGTSTEGSTFLLINCQAIECKKEYIQTSRDDIEVKICVRNLEIKAIAKWFENRRSPQRIFNINPKHGENGKGAQSLNKGDEVSSLNCNRDEASALLCKAIGLNFRTLYFYDVNRNQYIKFKKEGENVYHGYHLHQKDEMRIPNEIKNLIDILLKGDDD